MRVEPRHGCGAAAYAKMPAYHDVMMSVTKKTPISADVIAMLRCRIKFGFGAML